MKVRIKRVEPLPSVKFPCGFIIEPPEARKFFEGMFPAVARPSIKIIFEFDGREASVVLPADASEGEAIEEIRRFVGARVPPPDESVERWKRLEGREFEVEIPSRRERKLDELLKKSTKLSAEQRRELHELLSRLADEAMAELYRALREYFGE